jgi:toxin secretion/phage lysis holin
MTVEIKLMITSITGFLVWIFGGWSYTLSILITIIVLDYITGLVSAAYTQQLSSAIGFFGIYKKISILITVVLVAQIDSFLLQNNTLRNIVIYWYIINETISVLENLGQVKVLIPKFLRSYFKKLKTDGDK